MIVFLWSLKFWMYPTLLHFWSQKYRVYPTLLFFWSQKRARLGWSDESSTPQLPTPRDEPGEGAVTARTLHCCWDRGLEGCAAPQRRREQSRAEQSSSSLPHPPCSDCCAASEGWKSLSKLIEHKLTQHLLPVFSLPSFLGEVKQSCAREERQGVRAELWG